MAPKTHPTLQTVARLAEVSPSTVSRALRGHKLLNIETITRIRAIAERVGYRANPLISGLMRRVRRRGRLHDLGTIAYLTFHETPTGWRDNSTYHEFYEGAVRRARELGFTLESIWAREPHLTARRLAQILKTRGVAGVIIGPRPSGFKADLPDWSLFPVAVVGVPVPGLELHRAGSHHLKNMEHILAALTARGYRKPGLALLTHQMPSTDRGWLATWALYQEILPPAHRVPVLTLAASSQKKFSTWYRRYRPDVIIGLEDFIPIWLVALGQQVPADVGFARLSRPFSGDGPSGLHQFPDAIGAATVDLTANQIFANEHGVPVISRALLIEGQWIDGTTTRPLPGR